MNSPIGWVFQHDETGRMTFCPNDGVNTPEVFAELNPRYALISAAYSTPPPASQSATSSDELPEGLEWRWVDDAGRAMTNWSTAAPPPVLDLSDAKGTMHVEVRVANGGRP